MGLSSGQFALPQFLCHFIRIEFLSPTFRKEFSYIWVNIIAGAVFLLVRVNEAFYSVAGFFPPLWSVTGGNEFFRSVSFCTDES